MGGEDCTACGVGCGGNGQGSLAYVGSGQGDYIQETTYKYVGCGGDFARPRRDFTCLITTCCLLSLLLLIPLLLWLLSGTASTLPYDCESGFTQWETTWSPAQQEFCCSTMGRGCTTALPETTRAADKKAWCCRNHHRGCPPTAPPPQPIVMPAPQPIVMPAPQPVAPADPYNCAEGFANWQAGWSVPKKEWCCRVHGKGCPGQQAGGCAPAGTTSAPYDCNAGFANWMVGWSVAKKDWCCQNAGKGCPPAAGGCA